MSKHFFDISFHNGDLVTYLGQCENNKRGYQQAITNLNNQTDFATDEWFICFENTGAYSKHFLNWLVDHDIPCREENPLLISRSLGLRRGKSDKVDSIDICTYVFEKRDSIKPSVIPVLLISRLKKLLSQRDLLIKQKTALEVSLKEQVQILDPEFYDDLK